MNIRNLFFKWKLNKWFVFFFCLILWSIINRIESGEFWWDFIYLCGGNFFFFCGNVVLWIKDDL